MDLGPDRLTASVIRDEDVMRVALGELYGLTARPGNPDMLVIVADRYGLAGGRPDRPCFVHFGQVILGLVFPVHNPGSLIPDQDLIVRRKAIIIVTGSEEAIVTKEFSVVEQLRLNLLAVGGGSEYGGCCQHGGHTNRHSDQRADK